MPKNIKQKAPNKSIVGFLSAVLLIACNGKLPQRVDYPYYAFRNSCSQEIVSIDRSDTATVFSMLSNYHPHMWIRYAKDTYLTDGNQQYALVRGEGITPGEEFYMDDSGKAEFKLIFEPIPPKVRFVHLIEGKNSKGAFNFYYIDLINILKRELGKNGYTVIGSFGNLPNGHKKYWLRKDL